MESYKVILSVIAGSRLYGYAGPDSDLDVRGIFIPSIDCLLGLKKFDQIENKIDDSVLFSVQKSFALLQKGHAQLLEILFAPSSNIIELTPEGQLLIENRQIFVTKNSVKSILGFANAEVRKARALGLCIKMEKVRPPLREILENLTTSTNLHNYERDQIYDIIFANRDDDPREEVYTARKLGEKRKESIEKYGYSVKNACNAIRLLHQAESLINDGRITYPLPYCSFYKDIRSGNITLDQFNMEFNAVNQRVMQKSRSCDLPKIPDVLVVRNLYKEIIKGELYADKDC